MLDVPGHKGYYGYELDNGELRIYALTRMHSNDLLPTLISDIFSALWLDETEEIHEISMWKLEG